MDKQLEKIIKELKKDKDFAVLTDEELLEMAELELKAKANAKNYVVSDKKEKAEKKPRLPKNSSEKKEIFEDIVNFLQEKYENVTILNQDKLIQIVFGNKTFKVDLIEQRLKKNN